jgi:TonB family protein
MTTSFGFRRGAAALGLALATGGAALGQHALYVNDGEHAMRLVRRVDRREPYVAHDGKLSPPAPFDNAAGNLSRRYQLQPAEEYLPAFVGVRLIKASFAHGSSESVRRLDWRFQFTAAFASDFRLDDVFFVLEFATDDVGRKYWVQEVPAADLRSARPISIEVPLSSVGSQEKYALHVFANGLEVFTSTLPRPAIDAALRAMVAKRVKGIRDAAPKPLTGPLPAYPANFPSRATGHATIRCVIASDGQPRDATIVNASDPAFGGAALQAMSEWWFLPKVVAGKPVESAAALPFDFTPPP